MSHSSTSGALCKAGKRVGLDVKREVQQFLHLSAIKNTYRTWQLEQSSELEYVLLFSSVETLGMQGAVLSFASSSRVQNKSNQSS